MRNGEGALTYANGTVQRGTWQNDEFVVRVKPIHT